MKLTLEKPDKFKRGISILSDIITESTLKATENGLEVDAMDPANVSKVSFRIPKEAFSEYDVGEEASLSINFNNLRKILRRLKKSDTLTLEKKQNKLKLIYKGNNTKTYSVPLIDLHEDQKSLKDLDTEVDIDLPSKMFSEAIDDVDVVSEAVKFSAEPGVFNVTAEGDLSEAEVNLTESEDITIKTGSHQQSRYSIEYLKKMIKADKICDQVKVKFSESYPVLLDYKKEGEVELSFILAPRVDNI